MKLRNYLTLVSIVGGLAFGAASASAHCGSCGAGGDHKEHACPADCAKECCKDKEKKSGDEKKSCPAGCEKECCKDKEKKQDS